MSQISFRYWLVYPVERIKDPLIYRFGRIFNIPFNLKTASIGLEAGIVSIEFLTDSEKIRQAILWFEEQGISVCPAELGTIADDWSI